jgi:hypothetical protein
MPSGSRKPNPESQVVDFIDLLVEQQLQQESSGYDHNINQPGPCEYCGMVWHGLKSEVTGCPGAFATQEELQVWMDSTTKALAEAMDNLFDFGETFSSLQSLAEMATQVMQNVMDSICSIFGVPNNITGIISDLATILVPLGEIPELPDVRELQELLEHSGQEAPPL